MEPSFKKGPLGFYPHFRFPNVPYMNRYKHFVHNHEPIKESSKSENEIKSKENHKGDSIFYTSLNEPIFELFGIKLFFDDMLLISLIFFLYNEGIHDQYLFIALILLLLS